MPIQYKDYYEILGISREAGDQDVRRAFRNLARLYHPDVCGNDRQAEERFKEINEAYEVLGDRQKRERYDEFHHAWQNSSADEAWDRFAEAGSFNDRDGSGHFTFGGSGFSEFFEHLFGPRPQESERERKPKATSDELKGDDLEADIWVTLSEVATGGVRPLALRQAVRCNVCYGMGQYNAQRCNHCHGAGTMVCGITCSVKIPAGVREGALLRIPGKGEQGVRGAAPGDLYLKVKYTPHPDFRIEDANLVHDLELAPWEAVLGASVEVPTMTGPVSIKVPAGTQNGQKLRVRGRGLPSRSGPAGDLLIAVKVQLPAATQARERQLWEQLARESTFNPRQSEQNRVASSFNN
jgi:curved DNA-binding protein